MQGVLLASEALQGEKWAGYVMPRRDNVDSLENGGRTPSKSENTSSRDITYHRDLSASFPMSWRSERGNRWRGGGETEEEAKSVRTRRPTG